MAPPSTERLTVADFEICFASREVRLLLGGPPDVDVFGGCRDRKKCVSATLTVAFDKDLRRINRIALLHQQNTPALD